MTRDAAPDAHTFYGSDGALVIACVDGPMPPAVRVMLGDRILRWTLTPDAETPEPAPVERWVTCPHCGNTQGYNGHRYAPCQPGDLAWGAWQYELAAKARQDAAVAAVLAQVTS